MLHLENFFEKSFALLLTTPSKRKNIKKLLTNRGLHDILNEQSARDKLLKRENDPIAGVAELADAPDLGSGGNPCRFKSCRPH